MGTRHRITRYRDLPLFSLGLRTVIQGGSTLRSLSFHDDYRSFDVESGSPLSFAARIILEGTSVALSDAAKALHEVVRVLLRGRPARHLIVRTQIGEVKALFHKELNNGLAHSAFVRAKGFAHIVSDAQGNLRFCPSEDGGAGSRKKRGYQGRREREKNSVSNTSIKKRLTPNRHFVCKALILLVSPDGFEPSTY